MKQSSLTKKRNNELKDKYNVTLFPTFVFVDHTGRVLSRAFYDDAKLREKEKKGSPMAWMSYIDKVGDMKPEGTQLKLLNGLPEGRKAALRHELPLLMVVSDPRSPSQKERTDRFLNDPGVIRFVNSTMKVTHIVPTDRSDRSIEGRSFRAFKVQHNLPNSSPQIVIYDVVKDKIVYRAGSFAGGRVKSVLMQIEKALPKIPYNGEWIEDYQKGKAIAAQTKRTIVLSFIGSDWDPYSQQLQREIYDVKEFQDYAKDNLVLVKFDYPKKKAQSEEIKQQNKQLADIYSIRGYPTVVILNAGGQLIAKAGYQKGGPKPFLAEVKAVRRKDLARHDHPSQW
jgi:protein disulfide-isomerase